MKLCAMIAAAALVAMVAKPNPAAAYTIDTIVSDDDAYGNQSASIDSTATGAAAVANVYSAISGFQFDIFFTNASGIITDVLTNDPSGGGLVPGDLLALYGANSGNSFIGDSCASVVGGSSECLVATGLSQDLTGFFNTYGNGICCGDSDLSVVIGEGAPIPEPAALPVFAAALAGLAFARRRASV